MSAILNQWGKHELPIVFSKLINWKNLRYIILYTKINPVSIKDLNKMIKILKL